jgi:hypothetical protein
MSTSAAPALTDRSDFRNVMIAGRNLGLVTAVAVVAVSFLSRSLPAGLIHDLVLMLVVLAGMVAASLLPAQWVGPRTTEGIAGAAAAGFWGTIVFSIVDIAVLRPLNHVVTIYPWTWDAIGGRSTWWYLPIWWMLGTVLAWMGGMLIAGRSAKGKPTAIRDVVPPVLAGAVLLAIVARFAGWPGPLAVTAGAGYTLTLTVLAVAAIARKA